MKKSGPLLPTLADPDMAALHEKMSQLAHKLAGPDASLADFERILFALGTEVRARLRAELAADAERVVAAVPQPSRKAPRRRG
jgi:hypothetical protein